MKRSIFLLLGATFIISLLALLLVIFRMSPVEDTRWLSFTLFFLSVFVCSGAFLSLVGALVRFFMFKHEMYMMHFFIALRQGALLAICTVGFLGLSMLEVATWWNIILLLLTVGFVELYFLGRHKA